MKWNLFDRDKNHYSKQNNNNNNNFDSSRSHIFSKILLSYVKEISSFLFYKVD